MSSKFLLVSPSSQQQIHIEVHFLHIRWEDKQSACINIQMQRNLPEFDPTGIDAFLHCIINKEKQKKKTKLWIAIAMELATWFDDKGFLKSS